MVADIRLLQGKVIDDLDRNPKNFSKLIEELALEIIAESEEQVAIDSERGTG